MVKFITNVLSNRLFFLATLVASVLFGLNFPEISNSLDPIGTHYISILKLIVLPYLLTTITIGIASVVSDPSASHYGWRILVTYPLSMIFVAVLSLGACFIMPPAGSTVNDTTLASLGEIVNSDKKSTNQLEVTLENIKVEESGAVGYPLIDSFIPSNVFASLAEGDTLKVVVFCIIFGAALAGQSGSGTVSLLENMKIMQSACAEVIRWLNIILPITLFAMVSGQVAKVGAGPLLLLAPFVTLQVLTACVLIAISALIIGRAAQVSPLTAIVKLRETLVLAFTTRSSFACIPVATRELVEKLHLNRFGTELMMPLGTTICGLGQVQYFVIGAIFISQMYGVDLTVFQYALIVFISVAAGFATSGATGPLTVVMISMVADGLRLPPEAAVALFIAIDAIIDPFRTTFHVYGNCAVTAIMTPLEKDSALWGSKQTAAQAAG